jgi:outer membrane immunogenic protein
MKKLLLGCISLAALAAVDVAAAADLPVQMPLKAPPPLRAFSWTGCYVGGYAGGGWSNSNGATFIDQGQNGVGAAGSISTPPFLSYSGGSSAARLVPPHSWSDGLGDSFSGGGTLGCNWQPVGSPFVLGLEGEFGYLHLTGRAFDPNTLAGTQTVPDVLGSAKVGDWYGMITGRLGYTVWDRTILYVKGGAAFVPTRASVLDQCQPAAGGGAPVVQAGCGNWLISTGGSNTVTTWTIGGGLEWAFAPNWSVKGEYMFIGLGDNSGFQTCGSVTTPSGGTVANGPFCFNNSFGGIHTAKIGLNFKFY